MIELAWERRRRQTKLIGTGTEAVHRGLSDREKGGAQRRRLYVELAWRRRPEAGGVELPWLGDEGHVKLETYLVSHREGWWVADKIESLSYKKVR